MQKSQIKKGAEYAMREKPRLGTPFQHVRILEHIRGNKWKAEWIEPNPGLVHYAESGQLVCPWKDRKAFLKEEADALRLREHNEGHGYERESPVDLAIVEIFENVGEQVSFYRGILSGQKEAIDRIMVRAGVQGAAHSPVAYVDRQRISHLPFDEALELARKLCAAEPSTVLVEVETAERKWDQEARRPGDEYMIPLLAKYRAVWALIRQWAGHDAAVAQREAEIQKLERLVWDAVYALQKAGLDSEAARLRRAIERR
jgi:hypothetical protein